MRLLTRISDELIFRLRRGASVESVRGRLAQGAFWALAANGASSALQVVSLVAVARILGTIGFGQFGIVTSTVQTATMLAGQSLALTATKHIAEWRMSDRERTAKVLGLIVVLGIISGAIVAATMYLLAGPLAYYAFNDPNLAAYLRWSGFLLFFNTLIAVQTSALAGFEAFRRIAKLSVLRGGFNLVAGIGGAVWFGVAGVIVGMALGAAAICILGQKELANCCRESSVRVQYHGCWQERRIIWNFSVPGFLSGAMAMPIMWWGNTLLVRQPQGLLEMGVFSAANNWRSAILFIPSILGQALLPIFSNLQTGGSSVAMRKLVQENLIWIGSASLAVAIPICFLSKLIMHSYGSGFTRGWSVLILLAISSVLAAWVSASALIIWSTGRMWIGFWLNGLWGIVFLVSAHMLVELGARGLAATYLISYGVHFLVCGAYTIFLFRELAHENSDQHLGFSQKELDKKIIAS